MSRRKSETQTLKDERLAVAVAYASIEQSRIHFGRLLPKGTGSMENVEITGQMIACSVNLLYAVELLIKATLSAFKKNSGTEHDLWKLYTRLPEDVQKPLENAYRERENIGGHQSFGVAIRSENSAESGISQPKQVIGMREVLKHSRHKYSQFRYAFEYEGNKDEVQFLHLQFGDLLRVADCLILLINLVLEARASGKTSAELRIPPPSEALKTAFEQNDEAVT